MPIRPENRARYPKDWKKISYRIRFGRAAGRCECSGECGLDHDGRCAAIHAEPHPTTGSKVVLTTAHLADPIEDCSDDNLRAMCQQCHNRYDAPARRAGIRERANANQVALPFPTNIASLPGDSCRPIPQQVGSNSSHNTPGYVAPRDAFAPAVCGPFIHSHSDSSEVG